MKTASRQLYRSVLSHTRASVLHAVQIARTEDWTRHIVEEYQDAYERCMRSCDAVRRGHWPSQDAELSFTQEHVMRVMADTTGFVDLVNFSHIRKMLLDAAQESAK